MVADLVGLKGELVVGTAERPGLSPAEDVRPAVDGDGHFERCPCFRSLTITGSTASGSPPGWEARPSPLAGRGGFSCSGLVSFWVSIFPSYTAQDNRRRSSYRSCSRASRALVIAVRWPTTPFSTARQGSRRERHDAAIAPAPRRVRVTQGSTRLFCLSQLSQNCLPATYSPTRSGGSKGPHLAKSSWLWAAALSGRIGRGNTVFATPTAGSAKGRLITMSARIAATKLMAAAITNAWWYPAITAPAPCCRYTLVADPAMLTRIASPTAVPTCWAVPRRPEAVP